MYRPPSASPHANPGGLCSLGASTSTSPTDLAPTIPSLMPCHATSTPRPATPLRTPFYARRSSSAPSTWTSRPRCAVHSARERLLAPARTNRLFVPIGVRPQVLLWGHSFNLSAHPGISCTIAFLERKFWWPELRQDVKDFVSACSVCAQAKPSHRPPSGLLQPLPIPHCPWSHIALDFITGLPSSNHHTTILTIVNRLSKAVHLIPLIKLPSASETATLLITHVVRPHGIPTDIVSDRDPQFTSHFWKAFCTLLGTTVSLSSGFHPQSNSQTEQANQSIETVLRYLCSGNPSSWSQMLP